MSYYKIVKTNIHKTVIFVLLFFVTFSLTMYVMHTDQATGSTADNISGYAWSENIGWIGFNPVDVAGCPSAPCQAKLAADDTVSGWAKALSADDLDWDGWIRLSDTSAPTYGITFNPATSKFEGYAWGGDVVGWVSFNCIDAGTCGASDYAVIHSLPNDPPTVIITAPADDSSYLLGANATFTAWGNDTDGDVVAAEWKDYGGTSDVGDCGGGVSLSTNLNLATEISTFDINASTLGVGVHYICVRVWDDKGAPSIAPAPKRKVTIIATSDCSDGVDNDDSDIWFDNGDVGFGEDLDLADPACYDVTTDPDNPTYDGAILSEDDNPQCSDNKDNDFDGLIDIEDPGCHTDADPLDGDDTYNKFDDSEDTCGDDVCDIGETFQTCPEDCGFHIEPF